MKVTLLASLALIASFSANAGTAYYTGEKVTGSTKQCYYDYLGSKYTKTVKLVDLCPLTIQV